MDAYQEARLRHLQQIRDRLAKHRPGLPWVYQPNDVADNALADLRDLVTEVERLMAEVDELRAAKEDAHG